MTPRRPLFAIALSAALGAGLPLFAQEDPPPFWAPPDAADAPVVAPVQKPRRKKPAKKKRAGPPPADEADEPPPPPKKKRKALAAPHKRRTAEDEAEAVLRAIESPRKKKRRAAQAEPAEKVAPAPTMAEPPARAKVEAPPPQRPTVAQEPELLVQPSRSRVILPGSPPPPAPTTALTPPPVVPAGPPPVVSAPPPPAAAVAPSSAEIRPPIVAPGDAEQARAEAERPVEALPARRTQVRVMAVAALWGTSAGLGSRSWDPAFGARIGVDRGGVLFELYAARGGSSSGNAYASTDTSRMLAGAHLGYWLLDRGALAVQAGGGALATFSSTHYAAQDVGGNPQALDGSSALKLAPEIAAGVRLRPWRAIELRLDFAALYRDGRVEMVPMFGAGFWVAF